MHVQLCCYTDLKYIMPETSHARLYSCTNLACMHPVEYLLNGHGETGTTVRHKSALADHCKQDNHVIDWESTKVMAREQERLPRWIRESVHIRRQERDALNRDEGQYPLPHTWDHALKHTGKLCVTSHQSCY